jgi:hypothetical protein
VINHVNKNIDINALESRLAEEIEQKLEFGCYIVNGCGCDSNSCSVCNVGNANICAVNRSC